MEDFASYLPRNIELPVGHKKLKVEEFTVARRDAMIKTVLTDLDLTSALGPFLEAVRAARSKDGLAGATELDMATVLGHVKEIVVKLIGNDLTMISCLSLDTQKNRIEVGISDPKKVIMHPQYGYMYSDEMFAWIQENLTQRQEFLVFEAMIKVNDFASLLKNYWTLITSLIPRVVGDNVATETKEEILQ